MSILMLIYEFYVGLQEILKERGRTMESVINQYLNVVRPMHEQFIEPTKSTC